MIRALIGFLVTALVAPGLAQDSAPISPCPNVFMYEPPGTEPGRWYGVVNLSTDNTLHSLWLNIVLDKKADILGNWVGDVSTTDNIDFKVENTKMKIHPGPAVAVRFFVQYSPLSPPAPKLKAIRLNGREICNADIPRPDTFETVQDGEPTRNPKPRPQQTKPQPTKPSTRPTKVEVEKPVEQSSWSNQPSNQRPINTPDRPTLYEGLKPQDTPITRPVHGTPTNSGPVYTPPVNEPIPSKIRPIDPSEYFDREKPLIQLPPKRGNTNSGNTGVQDTQNVQCGKVMRQNPNLLVLNGKPTYEGEWPWQIALYQTQTVDNKYICGGTLVSHRHVITAAHCVTLKNGNRVVNKDTLSVYLGKHNLRTSTQGVQIKFVDQIIKHPRYNASTFNRDLAILVLRDPVTYSDWVRPACLWPDDLVDINNVVGKKGSVVGWGFDETGLAAEELTLVEMPVVDELTCIKSYSEFFSRYLSEYSYCAGYRNGATVCNGDSGGGMVFKYNDIWFLRGLVSLSVARNNERRCDPKHYIVFTDLAKFLPWLKQQIYDV
ncbi:clotting factor C-like isoform X2 [Achroia grisella]|uniref:clotting factor C-like isoform X2 n=1 Tax=Achroia grisella TaxID=688607 RepID=UPI0027D25910|nr:clotting factor C-like isoform X2 [Achroia grisella]